MTEGEVFALCRFLFGFNRVGRNNGKKIHQEIRSNNMIKPAFLKITFFCAAFLAFFAYSTASRAVTLSFYCITNNNAANCATGQAQLTADVVPLGSNVLFWFKNTGANASSITDVYFDDGSLLALAGLIDADQDTSTYGPTYLGNSGVDFTQQALNMVSPPDLPGGNSITPVFNVTGMFKADSDNPPPGNGVNPGEWLGVYFTLQGSQTYADVINELTTGQLRVGLHVQAFSNGGSESFVNNPVPVPAAVWLFGSGLLGLAGIARRRKK